MLPFPICKQSCHLNKIYTYPVEKNKHLNFISMRMFQKVKFIWSYAKCGKSFPLKKFFFHEMFECSHSNILCSAQDCQFINNVETVIIY